MKYKQAMAISDRVDGCIKCSYAHIYDAAGNRVYTLQDRNYMSRMLVSNGNETTVIDLTTQDAEFGKNEKVDLALNFSEEGVSEAVCTATKFVTSGRVPVLLSRKVQNAFYRAYELAEEKYAAWSSRCEELESKIKRNFEDERLLTIARRNKDTWRNMADKRLAQVKDISNGKNFYVRVASFRWYPTNTNNVASGVEQAQKELELAKAILTASAVATVI